MSYSQGLSTMSWGVELWDRAEAVLGQVTEDTEELGALFGRYAATLSWILNIVLLVIMVLVLWYCS